MKSFKLFQFLLFLTFVFYSCKKDNKDDQSFISGIVKHKYTQLPIPGLEIQIEEVTPGILGSRTLWDKTTTNSNGEFTLKIKKLNPSYKYHIQTLLPTIFDTTNITYKFIPKSMYLEENQLKSELNLELEPSGYIATAILNGNWSSIPADTIAITSPFLTNYLIRGNDRIYFYVDPSKLNQFSWHFVKNGVNGNTITKQIYVPNYFKGNGSASVLFYVLTF